MENGNDDHDLSAPLSVLIKQLLENLENPKLSEAEVLAKLGEAMTTTPTRERNNNG
ncbi:MAG: hypothetical protein Unbinned2514contig1000_3 [Prokaryotic dsDNA virus sp.]|nr:MAG: hypothetical protein Unbinned2514contig1000_3 [Prokaryotic dsDNA virus sp.]|tara:strand:+ start:2016 stop:2183 length:168 start_codon:yes stop_codon:yes gene_type:complete